MVTINNLFKNKNITCTEKAGAFSVYEYKCDVSNSPDSAMTEYFMSKMNVRRKQLLCDLSISPVRLQAGAMQWMAGDVSSETGLGSGAAAVKGFLKGAVKGLVTGESAVKPLYSGKGHVMLEPTYEYILLEDVSSWGPAGIIVEDGMFLACESSLEEKVVAQKDISAILAGGEGIFNLSFKGNGIAAFESYVPREDIIEFELKDDVVKIDGSMAFAWSGSLEFTVERSSKSLIGSIVNKEGLVNVYRGTGKVWMAPTVPSTMMSESTAPQNPAENKGLLGTLANLAK